LERNEGGEGDELAATTGGRYCSEDEDHRKGGGRTALTCHHFKGRGGGGQTPTFRNHEIAQDMVGGFDEDDTTQAPRMSSSQASDILRAYALLLRRVPLFTTALPQSLLRHDKHAIKRAIQVTMAFVGGDEATVFTLKDAYRSLAFFVPDEEAAVVAQAQDGKRSKTGDNTGSAFTDRMVRIKEKIREDQQILMEEFQRLYENT
jgi:hypothetical protein